MIMISRSPFVSLYPIFQVILNSISNTKEAIQKTKVTNEVIGKTKDREDETIFTWCTKQLIEECLRKILWTRAVITNAPEGGTESNNLLNFFAKGAAR